MLTLVTWIAYSDEEQNGDVDNMLEQEEMPLVDCVKMRRGRSPSSLDTQGNTGGHRITYVETLYC